MRKRMTLNYARSFVVKQLFLLMYSIYAYFMSLQFKKVFVSLNNRLQVKIYYNARECIKQVTVTNVFI